MTGKADTMIQEMLNWLLEESNPVIRYRTQTELLHTTGDKHAAREWLLSSLPKDWQERTGMWAMYYLTAFAECGLTAVDIPLDTVRILGSRNAVPFEHGCADYMSLRTLVRLGLGSEPAVAEIIRRLPEEQMTDGGFFCLPRRNKLKRTPKSCVKAAVHALLFCGECRKQGIVVGIEAPLLEYFWRHRIFYRTDAPEVLMLDGEHTGWRMVDTFHPFEPMRVGLHNIVEAFCSLGYGGDGRLSEAWGRLREKTDATGRYMLDGTLTKSYLPKPKGKIGKPDKWVTFYTLLAEHEQETVRF